MNKHTHNFQSGVRVNRFILNLHFGGQLIIVSRKARIRKQDGYTYGKWLQLIIELIVLHMKEY